jgi:hypothetical protein
MVLAQRRAGRGEQQAAEEAWRRRESGSTYLGGVHARQELVAAKVDRAEQDGSVARLLQNPP